MIIFSNTKTTKTQAKAAKVKHQEKQKQQKFKLKRVKVKRGLGYLGCYLTLLPSIAYANVVDTLNNFLSYLTGDIGKAVAGLAIVGVGFGCFALGKIHKGYVIAVVIGIGIIFGTQAILSMLTS